MSKSLKGDFTKKKKKKAFPFGPRTVQVCPEVPGKAPLFELRGVLKAQVIEKHDFCLKLAGAYCKR